MLARACGKKLAGFCELGKRRGKKKREKPPPALNSAGGGFIL